MIPKIIHYCWLSKEPFPNEIKACIYSWKKHLPDYEFMLWNFSRFDIDSSLWVKQAFYSRKYAFAADYIRMYALYNYGGIYLDCDVEVLKSYNDLLHLPYFVGMERTRNLEEVDAEDKIAIEAATIGFEPNHPLIKEVLEYYQGRNFHIKGNDEFDIRTLPSIILEHIRKNYTLEQINSIADFNYAPSKFCLFPTDFFSPKTWWDTTDLKTTSHTYSIHHFSGTWLKKSFIAKISFMRYRILGYFFRKYRI